MKGKAKKLFRYLWGAAFAVLVASTAFSADIIRTAPASQLLSPSTQNLPSLRSVTPQAVNQGQTLTLTLTGSGLDKNVQLNFGAGINATGQIKKLTDITFQVNVAVVSDAPPGRHDVKIIYSGRPISTTAFVNVLQSATIGVQGITVPSASSPKPDIRTVIPATLTQGQSYVLIMTAGNVSQGLKLNFGNGIDVVGQPVVGDRVTVNVKVAPDAPLGRHDVKILRDGVPMNTSAFVTVMPAPVRQRISPQQILLVPDITSVTPNQWIAGKTYHLVLSGKNFASGMEVGFGADVKVNGAVKILNTSVAELDVTVADSAKPGDRKAVLRMNSSQQWIAANAAVFIKGAEKAVALKPVIPKCDPLKTDFTKGTIILEGPQWGFMPLGKENNYHGMPLLDDSTLFRWREANPGLAEWFVLRIYSRDGTELVSRKIGPVDMKFMGMDIKFAPTVYRPEPAFLDELLKKAAASSTGLLKQANVMAKKAGGGQESTPADKNKAMLSAADLQWDVTGYRIYKDTCAIEAKAVSSSDSANKGDQLTALKTTQMVSVEKAQQKEFVVETSDRWAINKAGMPNGLGACPLDTKSKIVSVPVSAGTGDTTAKTAYFPGDEFVVTGTVDLTKAPYAADVMNHPAADKGKCGGGYGAGFKQESYEFHNLFLDCGDGKGPIALNISAPPENCSPGYQQRGDGTIGDTFLNLPPETDLANRLSCSYDEKGNYNIRVYMLAKDDVQHADLAGLAETADADKGTASLYKTLTRSQAGEGKMLQAARSSGPSQEKAIADRAYMLYCHSYTIEPFKDMAAEGPLHLESIQIDFPDGKSKGGSAAVRGGMAMKKGVSSKAAARISRAVKPKADNGSSKGNTTSTCDKAFQATSDLVFYGKGYVQLTWFDETLKKVIKEEPVFLQSTGREGNPKEWNDSNIIKETHTFTSPFLNTDQEGLHRIRVEAMVVPKPQSSDLDMHVRAGISGPSKPEALIARKTLSIAQSKGVSISALRPSKVSSGGMSAVARLTGTGILSGLPLELPKEPPYYVSDGDFYKVLASDPKKPCKFVFAVVDEDKKPGEYEIYLDQEGLQTAGAGKYSGSGTMKAALSATHNGVVPLAIAVDFKNWEVPDGLNVKGGTALSGLPKTDANIDPPGLTGTVVSFDGIAGQTMNAKLDLAVSNKNLHKPGSTEIKEWKGLKSVLSPNGDWYAKTTLEKMLKGWSIGRSNFYIYSDTAVVDLSHSKGSGPDSYCGGGKEDWIGVHLGGDARLTPYAMELTTIEKPVKDWVIGQGGLCGTAFFDNVIKNKKVGEGTVSINSIDVKVKDGYLTDTKYSIEVFQPMLNVNLKGTATVAETSATESGEIDFKGLTAAAVDRDYGPVHLHADKFRFGIDQGGWRIIADTEFNFKAEGNAFNPAVIPVPDVRFGLNGRVYFDENAAPLRSVPLSGKAMLGKTEMDLITLNLKGPGSGNDRLNLMFATKVHLSKVMPLADAQVNYGIAGNDFSGKGPATSPFSVKVSFPAGQPTVETDISPNYTGPAGGSAANEQINVASDVSAEKDGWKEGAQYALNIPGSYDVASLGSGGDGDRFNGTLDLGLFGGPPVKAEFRLGYIGDNDYWLTRATIGLGSSGVTLTPYLTLYAIRGGLGYNFPINAFSSVGSLSAVSPDMSGTYMFMGGLRVGAPSKFPYMLDGDLTVKLSVGARMDFRAWLLTNEYSGEGTFHGYFQYASGNFDGMLAGKLSLLGDAAYMEIPENAATMHFGGGTWHIAAGKKEGPRIKAHLLIQDVNGYLVIGNEGLFLGGNMYYKLNAGIGYIAGTVDGGLEITPQPHITGYLEGAFAAKICAYDVCIGPSLNAGVNMSAMPVSVGAHACFEIPIPYWDPEVCGNFSL